MKDHLYKKLIEMCKKVLSHPPCPSFSSAETEAAASVRGLQVQNCHYCNAYNGPVKKGTGTGVQSDLVPAVEGDAHRCFRDC